ncbi:Uncharacterized protein APZ42_026314 [Daphnia magna]|uniref:Uncharacterized protein n=1 Tax=Daphnia magna TaxID=35525 RepID=A0A0N8DHC1_9CRUS|nr:Uncharacterized protein APZ42_026314 [Daphnia magna]
MYSRHFTRMRIMTYGLVVPSITSQVNTNAVKRQWRRTKIGLYVPLLFISSEYLKHNLFFNQNNDYR